MIEKESKEEMKKNRKIRIIPYRRLVRLYSFSVVVALLGIGFIVVNKNERERLERINDAVYARAFSDLVNYVCSINTGLEKAMYVTSAEQMTNIAMDIYRQTGFAKSNISELPIQNVSIDNMQTFFTQSGEYIVSLNKKTMSGQKITEQEHKNLKMLRDYSEKLADILTVLQDEIVRSGNNKIILDILSSQLDREKFPQISNITEIEEIFVNYPSLIYDGPFSKVENIRESEILKAAKPVTEDEAKKTASKITKTAGVKLKSLGESKGNSGNIDVYSFATENMFVQISKNGGFLVNMMADREQKQQTLSDEAALEKADKFLETNEIKDMKKTYYVAENGVLMINYAAYQDDVILYPDLIIIGVALDNGEIVTYEASGYLQNHAKRSLKNSDLSGRIVTKEEAKKAVSPLLTINSSSLALIPVEYINNTFDENDKTPTKENKNEVLCYEFKCTNDEKKEFIVYINAETGKEQNLLIIIDTGRGKLTV